MAFADMSHATVTLNKEVCRQLGCQIPLKLLTDSKRLFGVIFEGERTFVKRLMLEISAPREQLQTTKTPEIVLVVSSDNYTDGLTKAIQQAALCICIVAGRPVAEPVQVLTCTPRHDNSRAEDWHNLCTLLDIIFAHYVDIVTCRFELIVMNMMWGQISVMIIWKWNV